MFSGCPSDVSSLACVGRCQFSDRVWNPGERISAKASFMTYACAPSWCAACYGGCARETFESAGFLRSPGSNLRTAATPSRGTEWISFNVMKEKDIMKKPTPNPPETDAHPDTPPQHPPTRPLRLENSTKPPTAPSISTSNPQPPIMSAPYIANQMFLRQSQSRHRIPAGQRQRIPGLGHGHAR
jgi:hypothetical protein